MTKSRLVDLPHCILHDCGLLQKFNCLTARSGGDLDMDSWKSSMSQRQISWVRGIVLLLSALFATPASHANTEYYRHTFFDNSLTTDSYFYSSGSASAPSSLKLQNDKLPIENQIFLTPPNALRLEWQSQ